MELTPIYLWLIAGVVFVLFEAFGVSGVGFFFAGLGAIVVGAFLQAGWLLPEAHVIQFVVFFASTGFWAALLWKPMKKFAFKHNAPGYSNMVGDVAYVGSAGLHKGVVGEATWSGTIMKAELSHVSPDASLAAGTPVLITDIKGNTLIVKPK